MWTDSQRTLLEELRRECMVHMQLQSASTYANIQINNSVMIPNLILSAAASVTVFTTTSHAWRIVSGVLSMCSTILTAIAKQLGAGERAQLHAATVKKYQRIMRRIAMLLVNDVPLDKAEAIINEIHLELENIVTSQPDPSMVAVHDFKRRFGVDVHRMLYPDILRAARRHRSFLTAILPRSVSKYIHRRHRNRAQEGEEYHYSNEDIELGVPRMTM